MVKMQLDSVQSGNDSTDMCIARLGNGILDAIERHS